MEEAYNQEKGIVQHINTFRTHRGSSDFDYSFTQEWPVGGLTHQLSYDLPIVRSAREAGIGDVRINYRYQLVGSGETRVAVSPRLSVTLPTGDWKKRRGSGAAGIETMIPVSYVLSKLFTTHSNVGLALTPSAHNTLQIVPGFAVPIGVGPSSGDRGMFFYLSFEQPFTDKR